MSTYATPRLGHIVHYTLTDTDVREIIQKRRAAGSATSAGNDPHEGDTCPAMIVRDWADPEYFTGVKHVERYAGEGQPNLVLEPEDAVAGISCNLQVFLDGNDVHWVTSRSQGEGTGHWAPIA